MADIYVRSTDGNNTDNGSTWALAKATLAGADGIDSAGDTIYVSQAHAESSASIISLAFAGTAASPVKIICGNDAAEPPTAVAETATVTSTGSNININGSVFIRGIDFRAAGGGGGGIVLNGSGPNVQEYKNCTFRLTLDATRNIQVGIGASAPLKTDWRDCDVSFNGANHRILPVGYFQWNGGTIIDGGADPTSLFSLAGSTGRPPVDLVISGIDMSACATGVNIFDTSSLGSVGCRAIIRNCKLPASWSGGLVSTSISQPGVRCELYNCDSGDTNYAMQIATYAGTIIQETTIVRTGGASDWTTTISWKCTTSANAEYPHITLDSPEIVQWNDTTGSSITATVEVITDNVTLTDAECWLEVQYLGTSGFPLSVFTSDEKADVLASASNQTTSSETWTTTGLTTPVKQKLSVTFTPQEKGYIHAVVKLAKASTTVYVDPKLTVA